MYHNISDFWPNNQRMARFESFSAKTKRLALAQGTRSQLPSHRISSSVARQEAPPEPCPSLTSSTYCLPLHPVQTIHPDVRTTEISRQQVTPVPLPHDLHRPSSTKLTHEKTTNNRRLRADPVQAQPSRSRVFWSSHFFGRGVDLWSWDV